MSVTNTGVRNGHVAFKLLSLGRIHTCTYISGVYLAHTKSRNEDVLISS